VTTAITARAALSYPRLISWRVVVRAGDNVDVSGDLVICTYRVRADVEDAFVAWRDLHEATLRRREFVTDAPFVTYRILDEPTFVEVFAWRPGRMRAAHADDEMQALWTRVEPLLEERDGRPMWEFPHARVMSPQGES
jgi:hypothetical protein